MAQRAYSETRDEIRAAFMLTSSFWGADSKPQAKVVSGSRWSPTQKATSECKAPTTNETLYAAASKLPVEIVIIILIIRATDDLSQCKPSPRIASRTVFDIASVSRMLLECVNKALSARVPGLEAQLREAQKEEGRTRECDPRYPLGHRLNPVILSVDDAEKSNGISCELKIIHALEKVHDRIAGATKAVYVD